MSSRVLSFLFALVAIGGPVTADTIDVPLGADIQAYIDTANPGDILQLSAGIYQPEATLDLKGKAITLRGEAGKLSGDPASTLDGQGKIALLICQSQETASTVLENLIITEGKAQSGGGMQIIASGPLLRNCIFSNNSATDYGGGLHCRASSSPQLIDCKFIGNGSGPPYSVAAGGGMATEGGTVILINCVFLDNEALAKGGGMYVNDDCSQWPCVTATLQLVGCSFEGNELTNIYGGQNEDGGGGLHTEPNCNPTLLDCTFTSNISRKGGGGYYCSGRVRQEGSIQDCTFENNRADSGGGLYLRDVDFEVAGCTFKENRADPGGGGGIKCYDRSPRITDCIFESNWGQVGGGMHCLANTTAEISNCVFRGNGGGFGAAFIIVGAAPTVTDCVFEENHSGASGGAFAIEAGEPVIRNCSFVSNIGYNGGAVFNVLGANSTWENCEFSQNTAKYSGGGMLNMSSTPTLTNCRFLGNSAPDAGGGMIDSCNNDCCESGATLIGCTFIGNTSGKHGGGILLGGLCGTTLSDCSFTQNAPDGLYVNDEVSEFAGGDRDDSEQPKIIDCSFCGNESAQIVGAVRHFGDIYISAVCHVPGDHDGDGDVDREDFLGIMTELGTCEGDINFDGYVDGADLGILISVWGQCL